jgi:anti-sigma regulatory factor (Ser/Thr protein kinase)
MMGGMAGLEGIDRSRGPGGVPLSRWSPAVEDERAVEAIALYGNPADAEVVLPTLPESQGTARRLVQVVILRHWALGPKLAEDCTLLVSELEGNAVRHTGAATYGLRMRRRRGWIRIELRDPSRGLPCLLGLQAMDESGRGLHLIDRMADRWGVDLLPRGKLTWFEMRVADRM